MYILFESPALKPTKTTSSTRVPNLPSIMFCISLVRNTKTTALHPNYQKLLMPGLAPVSATIGVHTSLLNALEYMRFRIKLALHISSARNDF